MWPVLFCYCLLLPIIGQEAEAIGIMASTADDPNSGNSNNTNTNNNSFNIISGISYIFETFNPYSMLRFFEFSDRGWNISEYCLQDMFLFLEGLRKGELWAVKCKCCVLAKNNKSLPALTSQK